MTSEEYTALYEKYLSGLCTLEEIKLLTEHQDKFRMQESNGNLLPEEKEIRNRVYHRINQTIFHKETKVVRFRFTWAAAAVLLFGISIGVIFLRQKPVELSANNVKVTAVIKPGRNIAILTLADGSKIQLDGAKNGVLTTVGKTSIKKLSNGSIAYNAPDLPAVGTAASMNTISIPRGGQYSIILSDGTKVWLNSMSSLTYPADFTGNERVVELKGEAYFEVAHNAAMPFKVKTNKVAVEVLGTHFNVKAYDDEATIKTTLLEGSVRLSNKSQVVKLEPGEQGVASDDNSEIKTKNVKVNEVVAWKNGSFVFRHANIQEIMKQISRWYDVDVEYRGDLRGQYFGGTYSKYKDINELLKGLELTGLIHFKIEGRRIIAMP